MKSLCGFRESIQNLIRTDRPESPTNAMFIYSVMVLMALWTYATLTKGTVPHIEIMAGFIFGTKLIKTYNERKADKLNNFGQGGGGANASTTATQESIR